jgi:hypothetical protein
MLVYTLLLTISRKYLFAPYSSSLWIPPTNPQMMGLFAQFKNLSAFIRFLNQSRATITQWKNSDSHSITYFRWLYILRFSGFSITVDAGSYVQLNYFSDLLQT